MKIKSQTQRKALLFTATALITLSGFGGVSHASDAEVQALKQQMQALIGKIEQLEAQNKAVSQAVSNIQPAAGHSGVDMSNVVTGGDVKGSFKLPGSDTSVKIGGYLKTDFIYDVEGSGSQDSFSATGIPLDGSATEDNENFRIHAKQSRLNVSTYTPTEYGTLKTYLEGDFFGTGGNESASNSTTFRLRHAYGEIGPVLAGQTWSNFMDLGHYPSTIDFTGPVGLSTVRQAQVRYKADISENTAFSVALENPFSDNTNDTGITTTDISDLPDLTAKLKTKGDWGSFSIRGVAREMEVQNTGTTNEENDFGYGLAAGAGIKVGKADKLSFDLMYGDGIGRYMYGASAGSSVDTAGLEAVESYGGFASYKRAWTDNARSHFTVGYVENDNDANLPTTLNEDILTVHANLLWDVTSKVRVGGEYIYGTRETEAGDDGDTSRIQLGAWYFF